MSFSDLKSSFSRSFQQPAPPKISNWIGAGCSLNRLDDDGGLRTYTCPRRGTKFYSVTSILSRMPRFSDGKIALAEWESYTGKDRAAVLTRKGSTRGTIVHEAMESWIQSRPIEGMENTLLRRLWLQMVEACNKHVVSFQASELQVASSIGFAGTLDAVGLIHCNGLWPAIVDFKNYTREKPDHEMESVYFQLALYSLALWETTGLKVDRGLVIASNESSTDACVYTIPPERFKKIRSQAMADAIAVIKEINDERQVVQDVSG